MQGLAQPEDRFPSSNSDDMDAGSKRSTEAGAAGDKSKRNRAFDEPELDSALQLLVERAQYITGATGTALALPQGNEMVCRASAGASAPAVGARLQVLSGLTGESISRRQLLRCDNAETDPRVNLEACRALGIASIVVLPLFRQNGEVRGLIELFSDHPYAFEERDLIALERMADLTLTALDLAEQQNSAASPAPRRREPETPAEPSSRGSGSAPRLDGAEPRLHTSAAAASRAISPSSSPAAVPDAMRRLQKCTSCGFPVSEGRTVCIDCEKKNAGNKGVTKKPLEMERAEIKKPETAAQASSAAPKAEEFVPAFLVNASSAEKSWMSNPVNLLAMIVVIVGILVAIVVFR